MMGKSESLPALEQDHPNRPQLAVIAGGMATKEAEGYVPEKWAVVPEDTLDVILHTNDHQIYGD